MARFLRRIAESLPQEILRDIVSFIPTKARSALRGGLAGLRERYADVRLKIRNDLTFVPEKAARQFWNKHDEKSHVLFRYEDYWYGRACVAYTDIKPLLSHSNDSEPIKPFFSCQPYRADEYDAPPTHAHIRVRGPRRDDDADIFLPHGTTCFMAQDAALRRLIDNDPF